MTLTLLDQDGSEIAEEQVTIQPGRSRLIGTTFGNDDAVRGRLVSPEADDDTVWYVPSRAWENV